MKRFLSFMLNPFYIKIYAFFCHSLNFAWINLETHKKTKQKSISQTNMRRYLVQNHSGAIVPIVTRVLLPASLQIPHHCTINTRSKPTIHHFYHYSIINLHYKNKDPVQRQIYSAIKITSVYRSKEPRINQLHKYSHSLARCKIPICIVIQPCP